MNRSTSARAGVAVLALATLALPAAAAAPGATPDVATVLRESRAALGLDALPAIRTLHVRGTASIVGFTGTADSWEDVRTGAFAQYADVGPVGGGQGYDGTTAWNRDLSGVVWDDASAQARFNAIDGAYMTRYALWAPDRGGATVTSSGRRTLDGTAYDVLRVTPPGSESFELWFDGTTHLPVRSIAKIGTSTSVGTMSNYRSVHGLRIPFVQTSDTDGNASTFRATSAAVNEPQASAMLRRPQTHVTDVSLPGGSTTIPFELVDNHVVLDVTVDGKGPFRFGFDTGGANLLDADVAKQLGLRAAGNASGGGVGSATESVQFAKVDSLGLGGATVRDQVFVIAPVHAGFGMSSGKPIDGLIGFEMLARFLTTFDYANSRIVFRTPDAGPVPAQADARVVPFVFEGQHPMIPCTIAGIGTQCVVDTGSRIALSVLSPFLAAHPSIVPPNATAVGANGFGLGGAAMGRLARLSLTVGGFTVPDVIADLSTQTKGAFADPFYGGNAGAGVWKRFTVSFDYPHRTVTLAPNALFADRETYDRSGTFLITQGGKIIIADVRPGTPAAAAGLARGETIATIGGKDAGALGLAAVRDAFRGAPGTALALGVAGKDGTTRTVTLTLNDYI
ncbi:MAG TPA: aspartyl protease family protein [Candidatus Elarobacter sp.]|nr:aspartyl protease family protein [Candidatus Elarobacter sp.]